MNQAATGASRLAALIVVREQFAHAVVATKCHGCGCMLNTVDTLAKATALVPELGSVLQDARRLLVPKKYDCLGCDVCFPAAMESRA